MLDFAVKKHLPVTIAIDCSLIIAGKPFSAVKDKVKRDLPSIQFASWRVSTINFSILSSYHSKLI